MAHLPIICLATTIRDAERNELTIGAMLVGSSSIHLAIDVF